MAEEDRWLKLRQIVREELERAFSLTQKKTAPLKFIAGRWEGITEEQMTAWREAYPAVNIEQQLKQAAAWCLSNPIDAPKSQWGRFLNSWFSRTQNQHSIRSIPTQQRPQHQSLCANCKTPLTGGFTRSGIGDVCDPCWASYMRGEPWKKTA